MVQFLSINFFSWISSIFVGFFKSSRFLVSLCIRIRTQLLGEEAAFSLDKKVNSYMFPSVLVTSCALHQWNYPIFTVLLFCELCNRYCVS